MFSVCWTPGVHGSEVFQEVTNENEDVFFFLFDGTVMRLRFRALRYIDYWLA